MSNEELKSKKTVISEYLSKRLSKDELQWFFDAVYFYQNKRTPVVNLHTWEI